MSSEVAVKFKNRKKADGSEDSICLGCFKTISPFDQGGEAEQDHICSFTFPGRRASGKSLEAGMTRRSSDLQWQMLISGDDAIVA